MKNKVVYLAVGCLLVASLVLTSCGTTETATTTETSIATTTKTNTTSATDTTSATTESTTGADKVTVSLTKLDGTEVTKEVETPQYGGTLRLRFDKDVTGWDPTNADIRTQNAHSFVMEQLGSADWTRGPAGTDELPWLITGVGDPPSEYIVGVLAESWEQPDPLTIVVNLKEGLHWQDKAPVNGREIIADDVVFCFERYIESPTTEKGTIQYIDSVTATGKYTVTFKTNATVNNLVDGLLCSTMLVMYPPEVIEQYGDMNDWKNVVGSGPFLLTDVVIGSTYTFERNDDYWDYDPYFPENQLPYVDTVMVFISTDMSATLSAFRTGKLDILPDMEWQNAESLLDSGSEIMYAKKSSTYLAPQIIFVTHPGDPPTADPESPFNDVRVRKAMLMAIDREEIVEDYYKGNGDLYAWPFRTDLVDSGSYIALEDLPEDIREQFEYNPEGAMALLDAAGYSNLEAICLTKGMDFLIERTELLVNYWNKIGCNIELDVVDSGSFNGMRGAKKLKGIVANSTGAPTTLDALYNFTTSSMRNCGNSDPVLDDLWDAAATEADRTLAYQKIQQAGLRLLENCWVFAFPAPMSYNLWQPWVKNYYGQQTLASNFIGSIDKYIWLKQ